MIRVMYTHHIFQDQEFGGVSRYVFELAMRVAKDPGFDVSIVAPLYLSHYLREAPPSLVRGMPMPRFEFRGAWRIRKFLQRMSVPFAYARAGVADVIHETYYSAVPCGRAKRRVVTVHDMIHELFPGSFPAGSLEQAYAAKRAAVERADHVICVSEATRRDLVRLLGIEATKTSVVYHGQSLPAAEGIVHAPPGGRPYLLYVGARAGYKNFSRVCAAYAASGDLKHAVDLVAFGGGNFTAPERQMFSELGIAAHIRHASGGDEQLGAHYRGALAFVYPSLYEGFGFPPLEAMACGCPVVCSNTSSIPEVAGDAALYVDPHSLDDVRTALEKIVGDTGLRERLIGAGKARAALFSWERCARETMDIYRGLA
jgi:glycosyltransferase involved in cell wall biosynthesis